MKKIGCLNFDETTLRRRDFLRVGSLGLLGVSLSQYLELKSLMAATATDEVVKKARAQACILLWLEGGPSHVDTWDPKSNSSFKPISTNVAGIQISELLPRVGKQMDKLAIIRSLHTEENNHPTGTHYAITGHRPNPAMRFPSLGAIISKEMGPRNNMPPHVLEPQWDLDRQMYEDIFKAAYLGAEYDPMVVPDPSQRNFQVPDLVLPKSVSVERVQERRSFLKIVDRAYRQKMESAEHSKMDTFSAQALRMITTPAVREAFDLSKESDKVKDAYGRNRFGQSVLLARRLVESGTRFVTAAGYKVNQWDCHGNNDRDHKGILVPTLDQALSTLLQDLDQRGLLESTIVLVMGEFGRTPHMNPNMGRDHWNHCWSLVIGGGGIRGGQVIGASDERGAYVAERMVTMGDVFATIYGALGSDWENEYMTPVGRPVKIANSIDGKTGVPIKELV